MKYKHVIFDIDGTLVDNEKAVIATWQKTINQLLGKYYKVSELNFVLGIPGETSMQRLGISDPQAAFKVWCENFMAFKSEIELFPDIEETILALRSKKVDLGLVTSRARNELDNDYALSKIIGHFNTKICVTDTPRPKPYPDPLFAYLAQCGVSAQDALYVGDSAYDSQCAKSAGVDFGLAMWGKSNSQSIDARFFFENPTAILTV